MKDFFLSRISVLVKNDEVGFHQNSITLHIQSYKTMKTSIYFVRTIKGKETKT